MKRLKLIVSTLVLIMGLPFMINAQSISLTVIEPLPEVSFAAFAMANNLEGAPRMFFATISGNGQYKLRGSAGWSSDGTGSNYEDIFVFTTQNFTVNGSRTVYNDELGSTIPVLETDTPNDDAIEDNISRGKPTGRYLLTVQLLDATTGLVLTSDEKELVFTNPAQTLIIRSPETASFQGIGGVIAEWDEVIGASSYIVRANVRSNPAQSLEEALNSGSPIIDNRDVGNMTTVNLRTILSRDWLPGQEIVLQVSAVVSGLSGTGNSELSSEIINFYLYDPANQFTNQLSSNVQALVDALTDLDINLPENLGNIESIMIDGMPVNLVELEQTMNYLKANPDAVVNIVFSND